PTRNTRPPHFAYPTLFRSLGSIGRGDPARAGILFRFNLDPPLRVELIKNTGKLSDRRFICQPLDLIALKCVQIEGLTDEATIGQDRKSTRLNSSHVAISYA